MIRKILVSKTKNDSHSEFFKLRNVIFDIVSDKTKKFFAEKVRDIAVTLDKVTVNSTSYTVIMTYFFSDGKIYCILNKLQSLSTADYDSEGTAKMVIKTLCETLGNSFQGLFKNECHVVLIHFTNNSNVDLNLILTTHISFVNTGLLPLQTCSGSAKLSSNFLIYL